MEHARRADRGEVGRRAVGFLPATTYTLLPLILRDFKARFAGVRLDLRELSRPQQLDALRSDEIQVGLLRPPVSEAELASQILLEEPCWRCPRRTASPRSVGCRRGSSLENRLSCFHA